MAISFAGQLTFEDVLEGCRFIHVGEPVVGRWLRPIVRPINWLAEKYAEAEARDLWRRLHQGNRSFQGAIGEEGLLMTLLDGTRLHSEWRVFVDKKVDDQRIILVGKKQIVLALPRRYFASDSDWAAVSELVQRKIGVPLSRRKLW